MSIQREFRFAAISAFLAVPALLLSALFLALFFGGAGDFFGPLNDFFVVVTLALLLWPAKTLMTIVGATGGRWFRVLTRLVFIGLGLAMAGQLLLIAGVISLEASFVTGNLGIMPVIVWGIAQVYLGLRHGTPSRLVGIAVTSVIALSILVIIAWAVDAGALLWLLSAVLVAALAGYFATLGQRLLASARLPVAMPENHVTHRR